MEKASNESAHVRNFELLCENSRARVHLSHSLHVYSVSVAKMDQKASVLNLDAVAKNCYHGIKALPFTHSKSVDVIDRALLCGNNRPPERSWGK